MSFEPLPRDAWTPRLAAQRELSLRGVRTRCRGLGGLLNFIREFWHVVEPNTQLKEGWVLDAICLHLEHVTVGTINRLLINVPPGSMKSLICNVFWPAWMWGPMQMDHTRVLSFSYAAHLTHRDNEKFRDIILSPLYQACWPDVVLTKAGAEKVKTANQGWKLASSVGGVVTGERGDFVILDDPHNVSEGESEQVRTSTVEWFRTAMSNRLNDMEKSAIIVIMQRVHEGDVSGCILSSMGDEYVHLMVPAEYDPGRHCETVIGWSDPREDEGDSFWPERFPDHVLRKAKRTLGEYGYTGQYQQSPEPKGGGIIKRAWWQLWGNPQDPLDARYANFPPFKYIVASLDTAYTEKHENDPSAMSLWGVFDWQGFASESGIPLTAIVDRQGGRMTKEAGHRIVDIPQVMLINAWEDWLELPELVDKVHATCKRFNVDVLLIENKAAGLPVGQELRRRGSTLGYSVRLIDPKSLDKLARVYACQPFFEAGQVWAPDRSWADIMINQAAKFPKASHDDLVDSMSQAFRFMRDSGLLEAPEEIDLEEREALDYERNRPLAPIYPV